MAHFRQGFAALHLVRNNISKTIVSAIRPPHSDHQVVERRPQAANIMEAVSGISNLSVAIPALILYLWFVGRVDALVMEIDRRGQELVNLISAEALEERRGRGGRTSKSKSQAA